MIAIDRQQQTTDNRGVSCIVLCYDLRIAYEEMTLSYSN